MEFRIQFILMVIVLVCAVVSVVGFCFTGNINGFDFIASQFSIIFLALAVIFEGFEQ